MPHSAISSSSPHSDLQSPSTMLRLYNTATKNKEEIKPLVPGRIGLYACGPTVYRRAHIGNLRAYVMEDVLRRTLENIEGFKVKHVMNITDVGHLTDEADAGEDKMEKAARESEKDARTIAREFEKLFIEDMEALRILKPSAMPRATEHIEEQIELVKTLEEKWMTYRTSGGIYFDTSKFPSYGRFGGQSMEEKREGARVEANPEKKNPADFALWKFSKPDEKRQMEWESPWGMGFPGWHAECSAMSRKELGQPFDIHAGGVDHIPVHHENEIAQSEAAYGMPLANCWMHVEFLTVDGVKMSKSLGNTHTLDDLRERGIEPAAFRLFLLGAHYRSKQNFTWEAASGAQKSFDKLERAARSWDEPKGSCESFDRKFRSAIEDDLNTPEALAAVWKMTDSSEPSCAKAASLAFMDRVLGLCMDGVIARPLLIPKEIKALADQRLKARRLGDWDNADRFREEIEGRGWKALDTKDGYTLERQ
jgi:cysteinyl-tRNA synthetase